MGTNLYGSAVADEALGPIGSSVQLAYNGATMDAVRTNTSLFNMASTSLTASTAISVTNYNARGCYAYMNITTLAAASGSTTWTLKIKITPPNADTSAVTICAAPPRSATGMTVLCVYPGAVVGSNSAGTAITHSGFPLPRDFQIVASLSSGATSKGCTMTLGLHLIV